MSRVSEERHNELEAFWRAHIQGWSDSPLNQREYCEAHGLPLKRFGNWRAKLRGEVPRVAGKLLYRRGGVSAQPEPYAARLDVGAKFHGISSSMRLLGCPSSTARRVSAR